MTVTSKNQNQVSSADCVVAQPAEGEFILQVDPPAQRDGLGNVQFVLYWFDSCTPPRADRSTTPGARCTGRTPMTRSAASTPTAPAPSA
jgi:hypothetical protein